MSKANEKQISGNHYTDRAIQPWDYIVANKLDFLEGNIIKYVTRHRDKNGLVDLQKAMHFLEKLIEVEEAKLEHGQGELLLDEDDETFEKNDTSFLRNFKPK